MQNLDWSDSQNRVFFYRPQAFISENSRSSDDPSPEFTKEPNKELNLYASV